MSSIGERLCSDAVSLPFTVSCTVVKLWKLSVLFRRMDSNVN